MMRLCWSADPQDTLATAVAPLCNQGIHSHFYPASASFLAEKEAHQPPHWRVWALSQQPASTWVGMAGGGWGLVGEEGGVMSLSLGSQHTQAPWGLTSTCSPTPVQTWGSISRETGRPGQGCLECFVWLLASFTPWWHQLPPELCQKL